MLQDKGKDQNKGRARESSEEARKYLANHPATQGNRDAADHASNGSKVKQRERESELAKQILVYHESQPADTGNDWMYRLKEESMKFLADQRGVQLQDVYHESIYRKGIETLVDKIFGLLQRYMFEFNQIAAGTDLQVTGTISGDVTEVTRYNQLREAEESKTYFRARLTTRYFSLTVRGADASVQFYLVPTNMVMALSQIEKQYKPIASMNVKITEQGMMWRMKDGVPPVDSLDELCMWLFSSLVQETKIASQAEGDDEEEE